MLVNIISWTVIFFILFSFGDMLLALYDRICKHDEEYDPVDKLLLGLCFLIIPLSVWSLWLPSNQVFLVAVFLVSLNYWAICPRRLFYTYDYIVKSTKGVFSPFQSVLIILFLLFSLYFFTWQQDVYDSAFYHFQNIRWNEEYAVVPGVANLDDRFGFNSNYFLLSAIFSFRFLLGEAIYPLQPLVVTVVGCWVLYELFISKYEVKRVIILLSYILLFWVSIYFLGNTSTDILPNFIVFYIIARIVLYPKLLKTNCLIGVVLPVLLLTCKLSFFPIGLISIYLLYNLFKEKKYKVISFVVIAGLFILIPWLIRNVVVSGYLIYPFYQIDLFSFDWKVPREVAIREKDYIFDIGYYFFRIALRYPDGSVRDPLFINILADIIYLLTLCSFILASYLMLKKRKKIEMHIYLLYVVFFVSIAVWAFGGPDIRFVSGILCAVIFTGGVLLYENRDDKLYLPGFSKTLVCAFILGIALWTGSCYYGFYPQIKEYGIHPFSHLMLKPYSITDQQKARGIDITDGFLPYAINNEQIIWVGEDLPHDMILPASIASHYAKFIPLECIEARGYKIQDGYRVKKMCQ